MPASSERSARSVHFSTSWLATPAAAPRAPGPVSEYVGSLHALGRGPRARPARQGGGLAARPLDTTARPPRAAADGGLPRAARWNAGARDAGRSGDVVPDPAEARAREHLDDPPARGSRLVESTRERTVEPGRGAVDAGGEADPAGNTNLGAVVADRDDDCRGNPRRRQRLRPPPPVRSAARAVDQHVDGPGLGRQARGRSR